MKAYCQQCGSGTEYAYEKPNFCIKCGSGLSNVKTRVASAAFSRAHPAHSPNITPKKTENEIKLMNISNQDIFNYNKELKILDILFTKIENDN